MTDRIFVIGGTGLVGSNIVAQCRSNGQPVRATSRTAGESDITLDKTEPAATTQAIREFDPDVVIDTAAFHAVDDCESERDRAWAVNAAGTRNAALAADEVDAQFVYLSTDYVFPGRPDQAPYTEADPVAPINYYARTKYAGEQAARIAERFTILRSSVIYGLANDNFLTWALGELEAGNELGIVDDQVSTATYAPDVARACRVAGTDGLTGLYHAAGPTAQSRFEFTRQLAVAFGYDPDLVSPISTAELGQTAPRPADGSLDSSRLSETLGQSFRAPAAAFEELRDQWEQ